MPKGVASFTCHERKIKECNGCKEVLPFSRFSMSSWKGTPRSYCNVCRNKIQWARKMENKIEQFPTLYAQCDNDDCCYIWARSRGMICPKCKLEHNEQ
jgi:hypothetical protein